MKKRLPTPEAFPKTHGITHFFKAFQYSLKGLRAGFSEAAIRQEWLMILFTLGFHIWWQGLGMGFWVLVALGLWVIITELMNTAVEVLADRITLERDPAIGKAKDLGSAAVFLSLTVYGMAWIWLTFLDS